MIRAVVRTELAKQLRRPRTWVALGLVVAVPLIIAIALRTNPPRQPEDGRDFFFVAGHSGLFVPVAALLATSHFLLIVVVSLFAGDAIAGEAAWGNLRYLLVRPVRRSSMQGEVEYGRLVSQLARLNYDRLLTIEICDIADAPYAMDAEVRKLKYLLESLV